MHKLTDRPDVHAANQERLSKTLHKTQEKLVESQARAARLERERDSIAVTLGELLGGDDEDA